MNAYERLLKYVVIRTPSNEESETTPSSQCQFDLANVLKKEMEELGICDVTLTDTCFLYGKIPATPGCENAPAIGFIAHMDTVSDYCDHDIKPVITRKRTCFKSGNVPASENIKRTHTDYKRRNNNSWC